MTDARSARTSTQVAVDNVNASDARSARTAVQVAVSNVNASDARSARTSIQVAIVSSIEDISGGGWGAVSMGI